MMAAVMPSDETSQITHYLYGVSTALGSTIDDNDLLYEVQYPDPTTGTNSAPSGSTYNQSESYTYDGTGEQTGYTDRNGTAHAYSYDQLGRLTADQITTFGTGVDSTVARLGYAFNDAGLQSTATSYNASGGVLNQIADSYDGFGQLTNEYQEHDGSVDTDSSQAVSYSYDATNGDRPTSLTYPNGREVDYDYDSGLDSILSRVSSVSDSEETMQAYTYLAVDMPVTFMDGNGVELSYLGTATSTGTGAGDQYAGLDRFGRITDQKWTNGSDTVDEFQYTYDADSNVITKNNMVLSGDDESFTYDNLNRLTAYNRGSNSESWSFDALGNWNSQTVNGTTTSRTNSSQNQVKTVGTATLGYDNNGNTLTDQAGQQYVYDAWNRLVTVKNSSGSTIASYTYDAEGRRITQTEAGTTTDLYYSDRWQVIEEDVSGSATVQFTWGPFYVNQLIASDTIPTGIGIGIGGGDDDPRGSGHGDDVSIEVAGRDYAEQDADWNVTSMTDDGGAVQERYQYDPTGNVVVLNPTGTTLGAGMNSSTIGQVVGYQGGWTDPVTGLVTFQYRDLNTGLGRWIEQDPDGYVNGPNTYQLELSNTEGSVDWSGLDARPAEPTAPVAPSKTVLIPTLVEVKPAIPSTLAFIVNCVIIDPSNNHASQRETSDVQKAIDKILATKRGKQLTDQLTKENRVVTINLNNHGNDDAQNKGNSMDIDPNPAPISEATKWIIVQEPDGSLQRVPASLERLIAHELGHVVTGTLDNGPGNLNNVNENENPIVIELGGPPRVQYDDPGSGAGIPTSPQRRQ